MNLFMYVDEQSWLHRIDPRAKLFFVFCMVFLALTGHEILPLMFLLIMVIIIGLSAGFSGNLARMAPVLLIILFMSTCIWGLVTRTDLIFGIVSSTGLLFGFMTGVKLLVMIIAGIIWLSTTRIEEMVIGMEKIGVPYPVAFSFSTAVRMIPLVVQNAGTIADAQQSRGLDLSHGSIADRIRKYFPVLVPALISVIRSTKQFSMSLVARGYGSRVDRSSYLDIRVTGRDLLFLACTILVVIAGLVIDTLPLMHDLQMLATLLGLVIGFILITRLSVMGRDGQLLWGNTRMVVLTAFSAALYAAVVIPFKGFVLIPGVSDLRPANALVPVLGFLFGPAGAWGCGIGCMTSDLFGTLSPATLLGFIGNFAMAWVPYHLWMKTGAVRPSDPEPYHITSFGKKANFFILAVLGAVACTLIIAWGMQLLGLLPFEVVGIVLLINNLLPITILSLPLALLLYPRIKAWGLFWTDVIGPEGVKRSRASTYAGTAIIIGGITLGFAGGFFGDLVLPGSGFFLAGAGILVMAIGSRL